MATQIWTNAERNAKYPHLAELYTPVAGESLLEAAYRIGRADADTRASGDNWTADQDGYSAYDYYTGFHDSRGAMTDDSDRPAWREAYQRGNEERLREKAIEDPERSLLYLNQLSSLTEEEENRRLARKAAIRSKR